MEDSDKHTPRQKTSYCATQSIMPFLCRRPVAPRHAVHELHGYGLPGLLSSSTKLPSFRSMKRSRSVWKNKKGSSNHNNNNNTHSMCSTSIHSNDHGFCRSIESLINIHKHTHIYIYIHIICTVPDAPVLLLVPLLYSYYFTHAGLCRRSRERRGELAIASRKI